MHFFFVGATGFEPATPWSQTRCATNCATPRERISDSKTNLLLHAILPSTYHFLIVVGATGFEPATPWSQTRCATNCATPRRLFFTYEEPFFSIGVQI